MATAIILSGGTGTRMGFTELPKQYIRIAGKPVIIYSIEAFYRARSIDEIVIVAAKAWYSDIEEWCLRFLPDMHFNLAESGSTRQESILSGLESIARLPPEDDLVVIHDAARPFVPTSLIEDMCVSMHDSECDGIMPVLPIVDAVYYSDSHECSLALLDKGNLYAGQAPEIMRYFKYYSVNRNAEPDELARTKGTSEIALKHGMNVKMIDGVKDNFKITTPADLQQACEILECEYEKTLADNLLSVQGVV